MMKTFVARLFLVCLFAGAVACWAAFPPGVSLEKVIQEKDGLSHQSVRAVAVGKEMTFVGTDRFLTVIRNDGHTSVWNTENSPLKYQRVPALAVRGTELWTTSRNPVAGGGTYRWDGLQWQIYEEIKDDMQSNYVNCIHVDDKNRVWLGTDDQGVNSYDFETNPFKKFGYLATKKGLIDMRVTSLGSRPGELWVGTLGGISVYRGRDGEKYLFTNYSRANGLPADTVTSLAVGPDRVFAGCSTGLMVFDGTSWKLLASADGLADQWIQALALDGKTLWIGTKKGVQIYSEGRFSPPMGLPDGFPSSHIQCLTVNRTGTSARIYVGTDQGLVILQSN